MARKPAKNPRERAEQEARSTLDGFESQLNAMGAQFKAMKAAFRDVKKVVAELRFQLAKEGKSDGQKVTPDEP